MRRISPSPTSRAPMPNSLEEPTLMRVQWLPKKGSIGHDEPPRCLCLGHKGKLRLEGAGVSQESPKLTHCVFHPSFEDECLGPVFSGTLAIRSGMNSPLLCDTNGRARGTTLVIQPMIPAMDTSFCYEYIPGTASNSLNSLRIALILSCDW